MLFRMPYVFDAVVLEKRCRILSHNFFGAFCSVEIDETTNDEAPVAMRWQKFSTGNKPPVPCETRWHSGYHWIAFGSRERPSTSATPATVLRDGHALGYVLPVLNYGSARRDALQGFLSGKLPEFDQDDFREIAYLDRETGRREAEAAAAKLLCVDGELFVRCREPRYELSYRNFLRGGEQRHSAFIEAGPWIRPGKHSPYEKPKFRADRLDDLRDYFRERFPRHVLRSCEKIEVIISDSVNFDDERHAIVGTARRVIGSFNSTADRHSGIEMLRDMPIEHAVEWLRLRDALADDDGDDAGLLPIAEHLEGLLGGMPESTLRTETEEALRRWSLRPVTDWSFRP